MRKTVALWLLLILTGSSAMAAEDYYPFASTATARQFRQLTTALRCLVCQNQTLADSNAPLAMDLRNQIYTQLTAGRTPAQIRAYLITRYGQFILYQPPFNRHTAILWCGPLTLLSVGTAYLLFYLSRNHKRDPHHDDAI